MRIGCALRGGGVTVLDGCEQLVLGERVKLSDQRQHDWGSISADVAGDCVRGLRDARHPGGAEWPAWGRVASGVVLVTALPHQFHPMG